MKFSTSILSAAVAVASVGSTRAFTTVSGVSRNSLAPLASTPTEESVAATSSASAASESSSVAGGGSSAAAAAAASSNGLNDTARRPLSPEFQAARDAVASRLSASCPDPSLEAPLLHFMDEYFASLNAASAAGSKNPDGSEVTAAQATEAFTTVLQYGMKYGLGFPNPKSRFVFENVRHAALRGGDTVGTDPRYERGDVKAILGEDVRADFYAAGCDFFRPSMDLENSVVLGKDNLSKAMEQIKSGENVVFLANHQSEADPQVVSCLFEKVSEECGDFASDMTYVAGHKVTTDALAVPFSMGRNLLCIHSKKHIDVDPETKPAKTKQNMAAMSAMLNGLKDGGMSIWVAPSGGRDRRDVETGKIPIAGFDQKTVDMFRLMGNKSKVPTHFYPMSMVSYDLCPPPDFVEAGVGERRNVRFTPIGISIGEEVVVEGGAEKRHLFSETAESVCQEGYVELLKELGMEQYIP